MTLPICGIFNYQTVMEQIMTRKAFGIAGSAVALGAALLAALLAAPAIAHHSYAMFDQTKVLYLSGTLKELEFVNPHVWVNVMATNDKGTATWQFEGGAPTQMVRLGWVKEDFKSGEKIEIGYRPMKDGSRGGQLMSVKFSDGHRVCSNRGCGDGTGQMLNN